MKMFLANRSIAEYISFGIAAVLCAVLGFRIGVGSGTQSLPESQSLPRNGSVVKVVSPAERAKEAENTAILHTVDSWIAAWERKDIETLMAHYTPAANIFSNNEHYLHGEYYDYEYRLFLQGGKITVKRGTPSVAFNANTASVGFRMTFQRLGGKGDYKSSGYQELKLRNIQGSWKIYEDKFSK